MKPSNPNKELDALKKGLKEDYPSKSIIDMTKENPLIKENKRLMKEIEKCNNCHIDYFKQGQLSKMEDEIKFLIKYTRGFHKSNFYPSTYNLTCECGDCIRMLNN